MLLFERVKSHFFGVRALHYYLRASCMYNTYCSIALLILGKKKRIAYLLLSLSFLQLQYQLMLRPAYMQKKIKSKIKNKINLLPLQHQLMLRPAKKIEWVAQH